mgnify:CR=1 FL=1
MVPGLGKPQTLGLGYAKEIAMGKKMEVDQFAEFSSAVLRALPRDLDKEMAQKWIVDQDDLAKVLRETLISTSQPQNDYFTPILDAAVPTWHQQTLAKYRKLAPEWRVPATIAVCYRVRAGFTLKTHAPKFGPCYDQFKYLQGWDFPDEPTKECLVFWIPRLVPNSISKTHNEQLQFLGEIRQRMDLPKHHMVNFGKVAMDAGLIFAHYKATGERVPFDCYWIRTDTCSTDGDRLGLGDFDGDGLHCDDWDFDGGRNDDLGVFVLGVEELGS